MPTVEAGGRAVFHLGGPGGRPRTLPAVCLHGAGGSAAMWTRFHAASRSSRPVYALDLPGHGRSAPLEGTVSIESYAAAVRQFLDAAGLGRVILVGHSMGGAIALRLVLDAGDRVAGLVLAGTGARLKVAPAILSAIAADFDAAVERICRLCYSPSAPTDLLVRGIAEMRKTPPALLEADFLACDRFDLRGRLGGLAAPALVVVGDQDLMTPPRAARLLAAEIPGARIQVFPGVGHMLPVEAAPELAAAAADFALQIDLFS